MKANISNGVVLIADDSADELNMLNHALINEGYTVFVAMDGVQAINIANRMPPDIVLMDALMPNMDGFEACKQLKMNSELSDIPVIFMTGLSDTEHVIKGLEAGGTDYVNKPVNLDELLARIRVHMSAFRQSQSTKSALDEIGQQAFVCDVHGKIHWMTSSAKKLLQEVIECQFSVVDDFDLWVEQHISIQLKEWLRHNPDKDSFLNITNIPCKGEDSNLKVRFLSRPNPEEFLLKFYDDNEMSLRQSLMQRFSLTGREAEVLFWLAKGKTNREIAQILSLSPRTVNKHLEPIFRKMSVENRTAATAISIQYLNSL